MNTSLGARSDHSLIFFLELAWPRVLAKQFLCHIKSYIMLESPSYISLLGHQAFGKNVNKIYMNL